MAVPRGVEPPTFGLGNRCSDVLYYGATAGPLTNSQTSHPTGRSAAVSDLQKKPGCLKNARHVVQMLYDANLAWHFSLYKLYLSSCK